MTVTLLPQIDIAAANHIEASEALTIAPNASFSDNSNSTEDAMADFRIIDVLGQRGMGDVYRAVDINLECFVALQLFTASHAANSSANTGEHQSLLDEAKLACKLNHPNIRLHWGRSDTYCCRAPK